jgi:hypothetical protein
MRRVFTSPRLENVEGVANLLREHEIEVKITNGRTFRGAIRGNFSYRDKPDAGEQPAVWVVRSEDQPKARELLREAGLLDSGRSPTTYLATPSVHELRGEDGDARKRRAFRLKAALFVGIAAALALSMFGWRKTRPTPAATTTATNSHAGVAKVAPTPPPQTTAAIDEPAVAPAATYVIDTPKALAALLVNAELAAQPASRLCLSIDGKAPQQTQIEALGLPSEVNVAPAADCRERTAKDMLGIAIGEYRTDGSGAGTIRIEISDIGKDDKPRIDTRVLEVRRRDTEWRVLRAVTEAAPSL